MDTPTPTPPALVESAPMAEPDYFAFGQTEQVFLPGSKTQFVEVKALNEGAKKSYQNLTNRDVTLKKGGDMQMKMAAGDERHALLKEAIVGWNLLRKNDKGEMRPVVFTQAEVGAFLATAPPQAVEVIEKAVRKLNPWTMADMSIEDIDREIGNLQEMRAAKVKEEAGNESS